MSEHKIELNISKDKYDEFATLFPDNTDNEIKTIISNSIDHLITRQKEKKQINEILSDSSFLSQTNVLIIAKIINILDHNLRLLKAGFHKLNEDLPDSDPKSPLNYGNINFFVCQLLFDSFLIYCNFFVELNSIDTRSTDKLLDNPFIVWNMEFILKRHMSANIKIDHKIQKIDVWDWNLLKRNEQYNLYRHKFSDVLNKKIDESEWKVLDDKIFEAQLKFMPDFSNITAEDQLNQEKLLKFIKDLFASFFIDQSKIAQFKYK